MKPGAKPEDYEGDWRCPFCGLPSSTKYWNVFVCGTTLRHDRSLRKKGRVCRMVTIRIGEVEGEMRELLQRVRRL